MRGSPKSAKQLLYPTKLSGLLTVPSHQLAFVHILYSFLPLSPSTRLPAMLFWCILQDTSLILTLSRSIQSFSELTALVNSTAHLKITHVYLLPPDTSRFMHLYDFTGCVNYVLFPQDIDSEPFKHGNLLEHLCKMKNMLTIWNIKWVLTVENRSWTRVFRVQDSAHK